MRIIVKTLGLCLLSGSCLTALPEQNSTTPQVEETRSAAELSRAKSDLQQMIVTKKEMHPEVQSQRKKIKALEEREKQVKAAELSRAKSDLQTLRIRMKDMHPEVQRKLKEIERLESASKKY